MSILGFPAFRYIDVNDSEEVLRAIHLTDPAVPLDIVLHAPGGIGAGGNANRSGPAQASKPRGPYCATLCSNVPGLFAAGDVRHGSLKRCASAVSEGAMAVTFAHRYLSHP